MTFSTTVWSQDIHYTNFGFSPLNINPALTGVFNGDMRVTGNFRSQWQGVPVSYVTFSGSYDMKVPTKSKETFQPWRVGTFISYDHAGYSRLNNAGIYLAGSYMYPLSKSDFLSAGISAGMNQRAFKTSDLTWDDQYVARRFDPNIQSMDATIFDETIYYPDLSAGLNYHHQLPKSRSGLDIGFGYFHINEPKKSFKGEPALKCGARYTLYGSTNIKLNDFFDVMVDAMGQWQDKHREFVYGLGGRIYLVDKHTKQIALQAGVHMRNGDAVSPHVGLIYNNWKVAVNFDSNFSPFKAATNRLGGPEINLIYIFAKVPPAQYCPLCPTYL
jgi:type IX secretion system PorP/SprF family membrane protein